MKPLIARLASFARQSSASSLLILLDLSNASVFVSNFVTQYQNSLKIYLLLFNFKLKDVLFEVTEVQDISFRFSVIESIQDASHLGNTDILPYITLYSLGSASAYLSLPWP